MPAVGMRRTTRVFGLVTKGPDSGRVLRSGRRLWTETDKPKTKKVKEDDDCHKPPPTAKPAAKSTTKATGSRHTAAATKTKRVVAGARNKDDDLAITRHMKEVNGGLVDRRFGIMYSRKRKRFGTESSELSMKKKKSKEGESGSCSVLAVIVKPYRDWFSCLLFLVLRYIRRASVKLEELSAFFLSEPICGVFASRGIQFLQGPPTVNNGICQIFGITQFMPLFCVDFSAVPPYFEYLHYAMLLKSMYRSFFLVNDLINMHSDVEDVKLEIDFPEFQNKQQISCAARTREFSESGTVTPDAMEMNDSSSLHSSVNSSRLAGRNRQYRNRGIRRRRRSLRKRKAQNPSLVGLRKSNGAVSSDLMAGRKSNVPLSGVASGKKLRSLAKSSDRSIQASLTKFIPVPVVREVFGYADSDSFTYHRPDTYISANGDELSRAMTRKTANYDMDSADEEWLSKFNNEFQEHVSENNFELIIDTLEKVYYCDPVYSFEEKSVPCGCQDLGSKEVIEAVYSYWMRKRKQRRSSLLRVFQGHQSKRAPLVPKPLLRKRRSFKRQPSRFCRGNQPSVLKAFAAEQDALEKAAMLRIEEANASAKKSMEVAIEKRKRAQSLAENVDLSIYKATMLVRIAEAVQAAESADAVGGYFLD